MNTEDETVLRAIFAEHDPANDAHERRTVTVVAGPAGQSQHTKDAAPTARQAGRHAPRPPRRRDRWWIPAVAAAAVVAVITPAIWFASRPAGPPPVSPAASSPQAPDGAVARAQYDHVRWQAYSGASLDYTVDWWFNGVSGRELKTGASGKVIEDIRLSYASTKSSSVSASVTSSPTTSEAGTAVTVATPGPAEATQPNQSPAASGRAHAGMAQASPAPTAGVQPVGDDFPGDVPSTVDEMRSYLAGPGGAVSAQRVEGIIFQRVLDATQMAALVQIARAMPSGTATGTATTPAGVSVQLISPTDPSTAGGPGESLVLTSDGTRIIGVTWTDGNGHTWWKLVKLSEHTSTTK